MAGWLCHMPMFQAVMPHTQPTAASSPKQVPARYIYVKRVHTISDAIDCQGVNSICMGINEKAILWVSLADLA